MEIRDFIIDFSDQFDDTDFSEFSSETIFRDLEEWSSLNALAILNMIRKKHGVIIKPEEMRETRTIQELYDLVKAKRG